MHWTRSIARLLPALLSVMTLTACETIPATGTALLNIRSGEHEPTSGTDVVPCQALRLVSFSASQDSERTVREVREQNAVIEELCP